MNDVTGGAPAFVPDEKTLDDLYALGFSPQDVFETKAETATDILTRRETKAQHETRLESEAETAEAKEAMAASARASGASSPPPSPSSPPPPPAPGPATPPVGPTPKDDDERAAMRIWESAGSPIDPIVDRYHSSRGLKPFEKPAPKNVRLARNIQHKPSQEFRPALLLRPVHGQTGADLCGIVRIYLEIGGKGKAKFTDPSHSPVMMLGDVANGVVRIGGFDPNKPAAVAEGYETGASFHLATGLPVFVVLTAARFKTFAPPADFKHLVVAGENDETNKKARIALGRRMEKAAFALTSRCRRGERQTRRSKISTISSMARARSHETRGCGS
jgi:hypothetical protein